MSNDIIQKIADYTDIKIQLVKSKHFVSISVKLKTCVPLFLDYNELDNLILELIDLKSQIVDKSHE